MSEPDPVSAGPAAPLPLCRFQPQSVQAIFDALEACIIVVDASLRVVSLNAAAAALFGRRTEEAAARPVCELFPAGSCPLDILVETLRSGQPIHDYQTPIVLPTGAPGHVLVRTVPLLAVEAPGADRASGVAMLLRDVTEETALRKEATARWRLGGLIGKNPRMRQLYRLVEDVAPSGATVLVRGETGTGKELVARAVHYASARADGPFVLVNCSALSEGLLESELFGHVRGAFTGALADRRGRFEEAHGGSIFLDEIGDVSPAVQVKLLRVLQERVVERVGDNRRIEVDVRVITATHRDLEALVAAGRVREDFYYRIRVVTLRLPPLRERREDIPLLVAHFLERLRGGEVAADAMASEAMRLLLDHAWPGNVRELENALEHAHVLSRGRTIRPEHLPPEIVAGLGPGAGRGLTGAPPHSPAERELIAAALARTGWHRARAARLLGIDRTTLWRKVREYGLRPDEGETPASRR